jgi:hypothetical protein
MLQEGLLVGRSTNYRRTIATLQGVITGLYPNTSESVPVQTAEDVDEVLFGRTDTCERLRELVKAQARALKGGCPCPHSCCLVLLHRQPMYSRGEARRRGGQNSCPYL